MNKENKALRVRGKREIDWMITLLPFSIIVVLCLLFFYAPIQSNKVLSQVRFILGDTFGTYYLIIGLGVFLLSIFVATSRYGNIVLGDPGEKPKYSFFAWGSMMFTAGLAADILFYSSEEQNMLSAIREQMPPIDAVLFIFRVDIICDRPTYCRTW